MGLRDQLLKAGLVNKKQAKKAEAEAKKLDHDVRKNKVVAEQVASQKNDELRTIEEDSARKREMDRALNLERDAQRAEKEKVYRCLQLMRSNRLNENRRARIPYFFAEGERVVRKVLVNEYQREMLARGKYGIGRPAEAVDDFVILPYHTSQTIQSLCPHFLLVLHPPVDDSAEISAD